MKPPQVEGFALASFNTASGKNCCNVTPTEKAALAAKVSILQAVRTVATRKNGVIADVVVSEFQYCKR